MNHSTRDFLSRFFALFIALTLALPGNALALREIQTKNSGLEEQELIAALESPITATSLTGLEENGEEAPPLPPGGKTVSLPMGKSFQFRFTGPVEINAGGVRFILQEGPPVITGAPSSLYIRHSSASDIGDQLSPGKIYDIGLRSSILDEHRGKVGEPGFRHVVTIWANESITVKLQTAGLEEGEASPLPAGQPVFIEAGEELRFLFTGPVRIAGVVNNLLGFELNLEKSQNPSHHLTLFSPTASARPKRIDPSPSVGFVKIEYPFGEGSFISYKLSPKATTEEDSKFTVTIRAGPNIRKPLTVQLVPARPIPGSPSDTTQPVPSQGTESPSSALTRLIASDETQITSSSPETSAGAKGVEAVLPTRMTVAKLASHLVQLMRDGQLGGVNIYRYADASSAQMMLPSSVSRVSRADLQRVDDAGNLTPNYFLRQFASLIEQSEDGQSLLFLIDPDQWVHVFPYRKFSEEGWLREKTRVLLDEAAQVVEIAWNPEIGLKTSRALRSVSSLRPYKIDAKGLSWREVYDYLEDLGFRPFPVFQPVNDFVNFDQLRVWIEGKDFPSKERDREGQARRLFEETRVQASLAWLATRDLLAHLAAHGPQAEISDELLAQWWAERQQQSWKGEMADASEVKAFVERTRTLFAQVTESLRQKRSHAVGLEEGDIQQHPVTEEEKRWSQDMEKAFQGWYGLIFTWQTSWDRVTDFDKEWRAVGHLRTTWHQRPASLSPVDAAVFEEFLEKGLRNFLLTQDVDLPRDVSIAQSGVRVISEPSLDHRINNLSLLYNQLVSLWRDPTQTYPNVSGHLPPLAIEKLGEERDEQLAQTVAEELIDQSPFDQPQPYETWMREGVKIQVTWKHPIHGPRTDTGTILQITNERTGFPILWLTGSSSGIYVSSISEARPVEPAAESGLEQTTGPFDVEGALSELVRVALADDESRLTRVRFSFNPATVGEQSPDYVAIQRVERELPPASQRLLPDWQDEFRGFIQQVSTYSTRIPNAVTVREEWDTIVVEPVLAASARPIPSSSAGGLEERVGFLTDEVGEIRIVTIPSKVTNFGPGSSTVELAGAVGEIAAIHTTLERNGSHFFTRLHPVREDRQAYWDSAVERHRQIVAAIARNSTADNLELMHFVDQALDSSKPRPTEADSSAPTRLIASDNTRIVPSQPPQGPAEPAAGLEEKGVVYARMASAMAQFRQQGEMEFQPAVPFNVGVIADLSDSFEAAVAALYLPAGSTVLVNTSMLLKAEQLTDRTATGRGLNLFYLESDRDFGAQINRAIGSFRDVEAVRVLSTRPAGQVKGAIDVGGRDIPVEVRADLGLDELMANLGAVWTQGLRNFINRVHQSADYSRFL